MSVNPIEKQYQTNETFSIEQITSVFKIRSLQLNVVDQIVVAIQTEGFYPDGHLILNRENGTIELIAGNHRYEAAKQAGLTTLPVVIYDNLTHDEKLRIARQSNNNAETIAKTPFVEDAEMIWEELKRDEITQEMLTGILPENFTLDKIKKLAALEWRDRKGTVSGIAPNIWTFIKEYEVPTNLKNGTNAKNSNGTKKVPVGTFTENLLRDILSLKPCRQFELVQDLIDGNITKGRFKQLAQVYKYREQMFWYCHNQLGKVEKEDRYYYYNEVFSGRYDNAWIEVKEEEKKTETWKCPESLQKLIDAIREKQKNQQIYGDFYEEVKKIGSESIDLIITDPPYNIANSRVFDFKDEDSGEKIRSDISQDFGEWDKEPKEQFIAHFQLWAKEFKRILKSNGSGYIFCADKYFSHLRDTFEEEGLKIKTPLFWCKTNPGTQIIKTNYKSAVEIIFFFTKCESGHTFQWQGENEMQNWIECSICGGNERIKDAKGKTLHPTQKPERLISHLIEVSSNSGDMIFDGFAGVGTVPAVAKKKKRKCIAIEKEEIFFKAIKTRTNAIK